MRFEKRGANGSLERLEYRWEEAVQRVKAMHEYSRPAAKNKLPYWSSLQNFLEENVRNAQGGEESGPQLNLSNKLPIANGSLLKKRRKRRERHFAVLRLKNLEEKKEEM